MYHRSDINIADYRSANNATVNPWFDSGGIDYTTSDLLKMSSTPYRHDDYGFTRQPDQPVPNSKSDTQSDIPPPGWGEKDAKCPAAAQEDENLYKILFFILIIGLAVIFAGYLACGVIASAVSSKIIEHRTTSPPTIDQAAQLPIPPII